MSCSPVLFEAFHRVCIGQFIPNFTTTNRFRRFYPQIELTYDAFCDDFGPMNLASICKFIELLERELTSSDSCRIAYCVDPGQRVFTNAVFLLGAYMVIKLRMDAAQVSETFSPLTRTRSEPYRDASFSEPDFALTLLDCWRGLETAITNVWLAPLGRNGLWGKISLEEYSHFDNPYNADLHMVVPGKLVAFRGPRGLGPRTYADTQTRREFSPHHYLDVFASLGVTAVVRLNEAEYDAADFTSCGISHHDLIFDDGAAPPPHVVRAFYDIVDGAAGVVAVHCRAGLGRTGTLIALEMMRSHGFGAREAMGWLRVMRPGSVIGEQQHYLERCGSASAALGASGAGCAKAAPAGSSEVRCRPGGPSSRLCNVRGRIYGRSRERDAGRLCSM